MLDITLVADRCDYDTSAHLHCRFLLTVADALGDNDTTIQAYGDALEALGPNPEDAAARLALAKMVRAARKTMAEVRALDALYMNTDCGEPGWDANGSPVN